MKSNDDDDKQKNELQFKLRRITFDESKLLASDDE